MGLLLASLPEIGQILAVRDSGCHAGCVPDRELVDHVTRSTGLTEAVAGRLVDDILAWYHEDVESYVRRRHANLHLHGVRNAQAYEQIAAELRERVVAAPALSARQLRRIVSG